MFWLVSFKEVTEKINHFEIHEVKLYLINLLTTSSFCLDVCIFCCSFKGQCRHQKYFENQLILLNRLYWFQSSFKNHSSVIRSRTRIKSRTIQGFNENWLIFSEMSSIVVQIIFYRNIFLKNVSVFGRRLYIFFVPGFALTEQDGFLYYISWIYHRIFCLRYFRNKWSEVKNSRWEKYSFLLFLKVTQIVYL